MRLAIPVFNGRVSPVFDFCRQLLVVEILRDGSAETFRVDWSDSGVHDRARQLAKLRVDTLLCGGITGELAREVAGKGIRIIPWVSGEVRQVLGAFLSSGLPDPALTMPGCPGPPGGYRGTWPRREKAMRGAGRGRRWR